MCESLADKAQEAYRAGAVCNGEKSRSDDGHQDTLFQMAEEVIPEILIGRHVCSPLIYYHFREK
jgi:hypothetical protein